MNQQIFLYFYHLSSNHLVGDIALFLSYPFVYGIIVLLIIWAIFFSRFKMFDFSLLFLSIISVLVVDSLLKIIFHVERPFVELGITPLFHESGFSFPSDHAAIFSAIAVVMFLIDKRAGWIFSVLALLIGISRMVIGVHYPSDILGGFVLGGLIGFLFTRLFKKLKFS